MMEHSFGRWNRSNS